VTIEEEHSRTYFKEMIAVAGAKPVGRIAYDINWLKQEYFLSLESQWQELLGP